MPEESKTRGGHVPTGTSVKRRVRTAQNGGAKSERTRRHLIDAARRVFESRGYLDVGVPDIVAEAGMSQGGFYTYFSSKRDVLEAVLADVREAINDAVSKSPDDVRGDVLGNLERANRRYLTAYRDNVRMFMLVDQASVADETIRRNRRATRRAHIARVERSVKSLQRRGLADPEVDAHNVAGALVSMLSDFGYWWAVLEDRYDDSQVDHVLSTIWRRALGLKTS